MFLGVYILYYRNTKKSIPGYNPGFAVVMNLLSNLVLVHNVFLTE